MSEVVLVLPGGGYERLADHEGMPAVTELRMHGFEAHVLNYPVNERHPAPARFISDAVARARRAGATRVALLGFSAGGHAAALSALTAKSNEEAVDAVILG